MTRFNLYPIKYQNLYEFFKKSRNSFWQPEEIDFSKDIEQWDTLDNDTRHFISYILSFFSGADGIIMKNIEINFTNEVDIPEALAFYAFQQGMEAIHNETYGITLETLIKDSKKREFYQNGIETIESVKKKAEWAEKWMNNKLPFSHRLVAMICVEGILFSGSFCAIFWLRTKGQLPGLCFSNELISKDEALHTLFGIELFHTLKLSEQISNSEVKTIITEAVENEKEFIIDAIPCKLLGMNSDLMSQYIEYVADYISLKLGYEEIYNVTNPFDFMNTISVDGKTNFFEKKVSEYSVEHQKKEFCLNEDF